MSLSILASKPKTVSKWFDYKDEQGNKVAEFKIRNIGYPLYQTGLEMAEQKYNVQFSGFEDQRDVKDSDKTHYQTIIEPAFHLIEDWKGIDLSVIDESDNLVKKENAECCYENVIEILKNSGATGVVIWHFITEQAKSIQNEIDETRKSIMGKSDNSTDGQNTVTTEQPKGS